MSEIEEELKDMRDKTMKLKNVTEEPQQLKFKLTDYQKSKEEDKHVKAHTPLSGYNMALWVCANGNGPGRGQRLLPFLKEDMMLNWNGHL